MYRQVYKERVINTRHSLTLNRSACTDNVKSGEEDRQKMSKQKEIIVKDTTIRSFSQNGWDYICITDIARQKNAIEPKDVVKNWMRLKNTIEYLGMWEALNNPLFKGVEFDPLLREAGNNGGTYVQRDIAF